MGIKSLNKFLKDNYNELFDDNNIIHISNYKYKKIAIDMMSQLYHFKFNFENKWIQPFTKFITVFRENDVHVVPVYDTACHKEKEEERKKRYEQKEKLRKSIHDIENAIEVYEDTKEILPILLDFQNKKIKNVSLLNKNSNNLININLIKYHLNQKKKQDIKITKDDIEDSKQLFKILNISFYDAELEAESLASGFCIKNKVDAVLGDDTDILAYGSPVFLTKFDYRSGNCIKIEYENLLTLLNLNTEQFLDFCIMCGTDYNKNIPNIGPAKAFKLISKFQNIESIGLNSDLDVNILNYERTREIFKSYGNCNVNVLYNGFPDFNLLGLFFQKKNVNIDIEILKKSFIKDDFFVIEED